MLNKQHVFYNVCTNDSVTVYIAERDKNSLCPLTIRYRTRGTKVCRRKEPFLIRDSFRPCLLKRQNSLVYHGRPPIARSGESDEEIVKRIELYFLPIARFPRYSEILDAERIEMRFLSSAGGTFANFKNAILAFKNSGPRPVRKKINKNKIK